MPTKSSVTLTAAPDSGSAFVAWGGSCGGSGTCVLTLDAVRTANATFNRGIFQLTVTSTGNGGGNVLSNPAGINCGGGGTNCQASYDSGQVVTLTATPDANSTFAGWPGS